MTDVQRLAMEQALAALEQTEMYLCIEVNQAYARDAHISTINEWEEKFERHGEAIQALRAALV